MLQNQFHHYLMLIYNCSFIQIKLIIHYFLQVTEIDFRFGAQALDFTNEANFSSINLIFIQ